MAPFLTSLSSPDLICSIRKVTVALTFRTGASVTLAPACVNYSTGMADRLAALLLPSDSANVNGDE